jgi:hypothetical protein
MKELIETTPTFHIFHSWAKWEKYVEEGTGVFRFGKLAGQRYPHSEIRQRRHCTICGKTEDVLI